MNRERILAHRGCWKEECEEHKKNSFYSLSSALKAGFSIETDIRDSGLDVVISHDPPNKEKNKITLDALLALHEKINNKAFIALNIKSDGLINLLTKKQKSYIRNSQKIFFFDMSIPELINFKKAKLPFLERLSEFEKYTEFRNDRSGVWIDNFGGRSDDEFVDLCFNRIKGELSMIVSPELHERSYLETWEKMNHKRFFLNSNFFICTDYPYSYLKSISKI